MYITRESQVIHSSRFNPARSLPFLYASMNFMYCCHFTSLFVVCSLTCIQEEEDEWKSVTATLFLLLYYRQTLEKQKCKTSNGIVREKEKRNKLSQWIDKQKNFLWNDSLTNIYITGKNLIKMILYKHKSFDITFIIQHPSINWTVSEIWSLL